MSYTAAPGATIEVEATFPASLGTALTVQIIDNVGGTTLTAQATTERTTGGGASVYTASITAPSLGGQYTIVWLDGTSPPATEDLLISGVATAAAAAVGGTFSYAGTVAGGTITSSRDKVRLETGDTDPTAVLFYDEEIDVYLANRANVVLVTAADLCDAAATKFARGYDFGTDGQTFDRSQMTKAYQDRAKSLRARASGITSLPVTKVDGYSQDVDADDVSAGTASTSVRQRFYSVSGLDRLP